MKISRKKKTLMESKNSELYANITYKGYLWSPVYFENGDAKMMSIEYMKTTEKRMLKRKKIQILFSAQGCIQKQSDGNHSLAWHKSKFKKNMHYLSKNILEKIVDLAKQEEAKSKDVQAEV